MSIREEFPGDRGDQATQVVASLIASLTLPSIEPFTSDNVALIGLPDAFSYAGMDPNTLTRADVARSVIADAAKALALIQVRENMFAACKAAVINRMLSALSVESSALELSQYQGRMAEAGCIAEIAMALTIPERTATALAAHTTDLFAHPQTHTALAAGVISFRHACIILAELQTLTETPSITTRDAEVFERKLLLLSEGCTASRFVAKARTARESLFPETLETRTQQAFRNRRITNDPGKDGMNWLILHIPTIAANAIMVHCTRIARAIKSDAVQQQRIADAQGTGEDCREYRTLDQLRADIAATLLYGQQPPATSTEDAGTPESEGVNSDSFTSSDGTGNDPGARTGFGVTLVEEEPPWAHTTSTSRYSASNKPKLPELQIIATPQIETNHQPTTDDVSPETVESAKEKPEPDTTLEGTIMPTTSATGNSHTVSESTVTGASTSDSSIPGIGTDEGAANNQDMQGADDVPVSGFVVGDGSGWVDGIVDGILEQPVREAQEQEAYLEQLTRQGQHPAVADPPLPKALVIIKVPFLGLLGITDEPAELDDTTAGPVPLSIARKLLAKSATFLRVVTDPVTGKALPLEPERYTLRDAERSVLQALAGGCYFPNCTNPVMDTDLDHVKAFEHGGQSTMNNLRPACKKHHAMKHFSDDKDNNGNYRYWNEPWRKNITLPGWTPRLCADGRIGWTSPSGTYHPPEQQNPQRPKYPSTIKDAIDASLNKTPTTHTTGIDHTSPAEHHITEYLKKHAA